MQLHHIKGYIQTIYLVEYKHGLMLLDGCSRADVNTVQSFICDELDRPFEDLKVVIVTHMHPDHAGAAHKLRSLTGCRILSADVPGHWYQGIDGRLMHLTDLLLANWVAGRTGKKKHYIWYNPKLSPDVKLHDGAVVPGFEDWEVLYTQGHTDRDLSVRHIPSGKIYVADLMVEVKGKYIAPYPLFYPNRYRQSLQKIRDLRAQSLLLAHGGEVHLTEQDFANLEDGAPKVPMTHWRSVKSKFKKAMGL